MRTIAQEDIGNGVEMLSVICVKDEKILVQGPSLAQASFRWYLCLCTSVKPIKSVLITFAIKRQGIGGTGLFVTKIGV